MNIYEKINKLQNEVIVGKDNKNEFAKYQYRTIDDIYTAIKPILKDHKVVIATSDDLMQIGEIYCIKSTMRIIDAEKPEDYVEAQTLVRVDYTRKGMSHEQMTGSAITYAHKYLLGSMLLLSDKDTEDIDSKDNTTLHFKPSKPEVEMISSEDMEYIRAYAEHKNIKPQEIAGKFKKSKLTELTKLEGEFIIKKINEEKAKLGE